MRRTTIIIGTLALLTIAAAVIVVVFSKSKDTASPEVVAELKADMERRQSLMNDRVIELLNDKSGQDALAQLAEEYDKLFYNGHKRFASIGPMFSAFHTEPLVALTLFEGEQSLSFPITYSTRLLNATMDDQFDIEFKQDSVIVTLVSAGDSARSNGTHSVEIDWPRGTLGPHGYYDFNTGETDLNK